MYIFELIAEQRIRDAMERGEFDNLPGMGKPLPRDELDTIPPDIRMAYKIMKNAGIIPEEVELRKDIYSLQQLINACCDDDKRLEGLVKQLNAKQLRYTILMEQK
ncbi:MAG TPA: DUF1992 domain-containing protein, partial [Spirochaetota bacterium]|nr:DUF1992 domain-containing protein [Spirochaetota bacterium]